MIRMFYLYLKVMHSINEDALEDVDFESNYMIAYTNADDPIELTHTQLLNWVDDYYDVCWSEIPYDNSISIKHRNLRNIIPEYEN